MVAHLKEFVALLSLIYYGERHRKQLRLSADEDAALSWAWES